jgi:hypothetical protein
VGAHGIALDEDGLGSGGIGFTKTELIFAVGLLKGTPLAMGHDVPELVLDALLYGGVCKALDRDTEVSADLYLALVTFWALLER